MSRATTPPERPDALAGIRIIECGDFVAPSYATKQLADLGAEVIKIEAPGRGDSTRLRGPFVGGRPDPERSGLFLYLNCNKRGIAVDLRRDEGQEVLSRLARTSDVVLHNLPPAEIAAHGLDDARLRAQRRELVVTSISPFGLSGANRDLKAHDLNLWCAGGVATLNGGGPGTDDLPPLKGFGQQANFQAGLNAAVASLGALLAALSTGEGQLVEISTQECLTSILEMTYEFYPYMGLVASRLGQKPIAPLDFLECKDGWIFICCVEEHQWQRFVELIGSPEWASLELFENRLSRAANWDALAIFLNDYTREQSVDELYHRAQARRIPFAPVSTMGDLLDSKHLKARGFFATIDDGSGGMVTMPGAPYQHAASPWRLRTRAPKLGEHTDQVLSELGYARAEIERLHAAGVVQ
ncbi:MAG TPA: CoA transferase [Candidatus Bathyarchaeia archaeon]|nr:CoA transferase [Candidatus Bathyarchaeia archaeon]